MYTFLAVLFLIGACFVAAGVAGRIGAAGWQEIDASVAAAVALLVTYAFLLLCFSSFDELAKGFEGICGGIPFVDKIADYGSLSACFRQAPAEAAKSFLDVVILSVIINVLSLLPLTSGSAVGKFMVRLFTGIVMSLIALFILNFVVKTSGPYQTVVSWLGGIIAVLSVGSIPLAIIALIRQRKAGGVALAAGILLFSGGRIMGILRSAVLQAIVYVIGIGLLEKYFGNLANGASQLAAIAVAFAPCVVLIIAIIIILKLVF